MSYCVNCGVELEQTLTACPLCHTPVYNPNQPVDRTSPTPYPRNVGESEQVDSREFTRLTTIAFLTVSIVCGALNTLVFHGSRWSWYVIGVLAMGWIFMMPLFFREKGNPFVYIGLDGVSVMLYIGMISWLHPGQGWYLEVALPIVVVSTVLMECFYLFNIRMKISSIARIGVVLGIVAVICVSIEVLIGFHFQRMIRLTWSAVVLSCCVAVDVILFAITRHKGARNELRRRMHF